MSTKDNKDDENFSSNDQKDILSKAKKLGKGAIDGLKEEYDTSVTAQTATAAGKTFLKKIKKKTKSIFDDIEKKANEGNERAKTVLKSKDKIEDILKTADTLYDSFQKKVEAANTWKVEKGIPAYDALSKIIGEESKVMTEKTYEKPASIDGVAVIIKKTIASSTTEPTWYERTFKKIEPVTTHTLDLNVSTQKKEGNIAVQNLFFAKYDTTKIPNLEALTTAIGTDALLVLSKELFYDSIMKNENPSAKYSAKRTISVGNDSYTFDVLASIKQDNSTVVSSSTNHNKAKILYFDNENSKTGVRVEINITKPLEEKRE